MEPKLISHRGNIHGRQPSDENHPDYLQSAINKGYDVECDVWVDNKNAIFLGHDKPSHKISENFLKSDKVWCHAKNFKALSQLLKIGSHVFWHEEDRYTLTSKGYCWCYPEVEFSANSVIVQLHFKNLIVKPFGVCSDEVSTYRSYYRCQQSQSL